MRTTLLICLLLIFLGGGAFGFFVYRGDIKINLFAKPTPKPTPKLVVPPGMTLVPWNIRPLTAKTMMTRELLINPETGGIAKQPINLEQFKGAGVMTQATQIVGRVLRRDMHPGYVFTEADFYPMGTRPGVAAAIPSGKRAFTIEASKLSGARALKDGDHVDLLASQAYDPKRFPGTSPGMAAPVDPSALVKQATVKVLAQDAVVITPLTIRQVPTEGPRAHSRPIEEIEIAVDAGEVVALMEAIGAGAQISCIVHSSQPEKPNVDNRLPPSLPVEVPVAAHVSTVETIVGRKHQILVLPSLDVQPPQAHPTPSTKPTSALASDPGKNTDE